LITASTLAAAPLEAGAEGEGRAGDDEDRVAAGVAAGWWLARGGADRCRDGAARGLVAAGLVGAGLPGLADPAAESVLAALAPAVASRTATTAPIKIAIVTARIR
jgi:hypothetical protein